METEKKIWESKRNVYVVGLSTQDVDRLVNKDEFKKITSDLDNVLKNFKCF